MLPPRTGTDCSVADAGKRIAAPPERVWAERLLSRNGTGDPRDMLCSGVQDRSRRAQSLADAGN